MLIMEIMIYFLKSTLSQLLTFLHIIHSFCLICHFLVVAAVVVEQVKTFCHSVLLSGSSKLDLSFGVLGLDNIHCLNISCLD